MIDAHRKGKRQFTFVRLKLCLWPLWVFLLWTKGYQQLLSVEKYLKMASQTKEWQKQRFYSSLEHTSDMKKSSTLVALWEGPQKEGGLVSMEQKKKKESPNGAKGWGWGTAARVDRLALVTDRWHFRVSAGTVARGMSAALSRDGRVKDLMGCLAHLGCRAR